MAPRVAAGGMNAAVHRSRPAADAVRRRLPLQFAGMTATLIDGKATAKRLREALAGRVAAFRDRGGPQPHLVAVLVGDDPASGVYVRNKQRACEKVGIKTTLHRHAADFGEDELLALVAELNDDESVHGILVQLPLPEHIDSQRVLDAIDPLKDVDCFHAENVGLMLQGRPRFLPCTPAGCKELLTAEGIETRGKHAVVLGRSDIVGKPMAALLMQRGADATVTLCHSRTVNLDEHLKRADIVVAAIGRPNFVRGDQLKPGCVVVDVGINRVDDRLVGDVDFESAREVASAITPVPGGVGPMTIALLLVNTFTAAQLKHGEDG